MLCRISLYLGRSPTLQHTTISPPQVILDDSTEDEIWTPHGLTYTSGAEYPNMKSHATSCFMQMCKLSVIFNQILLHMYDRQQQNTGTERQSCLEEQGAALRFWWDGLPDHLRIKAASLPHFAPPSHIVTLNCLFHTFKILLYRPMLFASKTSPRITAPNTSHLKECIKSATSIVAIYDLFCRTFSNRRVVLALAYSLYTAASIFLLQIQASTTPDERALKRMMFCTSALENVKSSTPVLNDALNLLSRELLIAGVDLKSFTIRTPDPFANEDHNPTDNDWSSKSAGLDMISPGLADFDFSDIDIDPSMFEAFSDLEPISINVGALHTYQ